MSGLDRENAPIRHRIPGIGCQVQQDCLHLVDIGLNPAGLRIELGSELDVLADNAPQHSLHVLHQVVYLERLGFNQLAAAEGKEL